MCIAYSASTRFSSSVACATSRQTRSRAPTRCNKMPSTTTIGMTDLCNLHSLFTWRCKASLGNDVTHPSPGRVT
eukprot:23304-Pyramimonas_sp.AAC.1